MPECGAIIDQDRRELSRVLLLLVAAWCCGVHSGCHRTGAGGRDPDLAAKSDPLEIAAAVLDDAKQDYIWAVEHAAFELEKKFGSALGAAWKRRDVAALQHFCLADCSATPLNLTQRRVVSRGSIREEGSTAAAEPTRPATDLTTFWTQLCDRLNGFRQVSKVKLRVLDLQAADDRPATGEWTAIFYLTAVGTDSEAAPIEFVSKHRVHLRFRDDQEIEAGRIIRQWSVLSEQLRTSQSPLFEEVTSLVGLDQVDLRDNWTSPPESVRQYYFQMAVEDFDRDGYLDLAVASAEGRWRLLRSLAGRRFQEVGPQWGIPATADAEPRSHSVTEQAFLATWIDYDNDGFPDLILGDRLFHNEGGRRFVDVTDASGLQFEYHPKGCVVADYDCDGLTDLYVLYQNPRHTEAAGPRGWVGDNYSGAENQLWKNRGDGRFENTTVAAAAGGGTRQSFAAAWLFLNEDRYPDLYIANDFGNNVVLLNQGNGRFTDISATAGASQYANSMGVAAGDLSGDGEPEVYVANMFSKMGRRIIAHVTEQDYPPGIYEQIRGSCAGNRLFTPRRDPQPGATRYQEVSETAGVNQVGWAYAPALADFDADGLLDIYATAGFLSFRRDKPDG